MSQQSPRRPEVVASGMRWPAWALVSTLLVMGHLPSPAPAGDADPGQDECLDEVELLDGEIIRGDVMRLTSAEVILRLPPQLAGEPAGKKRWRPGRPIDRDQVAEIRLREHIAVARATAALADRDWQRARDTLQSATWGSRIFDLGVEARHALARCLQQVDLGEANTLLAMGDQRSLEQALTIFSRARDVSPARAGSSEKGRRQSALALASLRMRLAGEALACLQRGKAHVEASELAKAHDEFAAGVRLLERSLEGPALPLELISDADDVRAEHRGLFREAEYWLDRCRSRQRRLVYGEAVRPSNLLPLPGARPSEQRLGNLLYESLVTRDPAEKFVPLLAERWDARPDGLVWSFLLRRDVAFSDGTPLVAQDVLATIEALTDPGSVGRDPVFAAAIRDVVTEGARRVSIRLARPYYLPLSLFTFKIMPRSRLQKRALGRRHRLASAPLGSGPFHYQTGLGSRVIELDRNPYFQRARSGGRLPRRPLLSGITMRAYADRNAARNDLEKGATQLLADLRPLDVEFFSGQRGFRVLRYRSRTISMLAINHRKPVLAMADVRRAIAHAVDRQSIIEQYFGASNIARGRSGLAHAVITGPFPRGSWAYDETVKGYPYHLQKASELLRRSLLPLGWRLENGYWEFAGEVLQLRLAFPKGDRSVEQAVNYIRKTLRKIGIRARLSKQAPLALHDQVVGQQDFDLVYWEHTFLGEPDPLPLLDARRTAPGDSNFSGYVKPGVMERFSAIQRSGDAREILRLTHEIHQQVAADCAFVFLWQLDRYAGCSADLKGVSIHPYLLFGYPERWKLVRDPTAKGGLGGR